MLPKKQKVDKKLFDEVFKNGRNYHSDFLFLKMSALEKQSDKSRFAVVIPKKISKKATERNLIKRKIFASLRENKGKIKTGFAVIIFVKKGIENLEYAEIKEEIYKILKIARLL